MDLANWPALSLFWGSACDQLPIHGIVSGCPSFSWCCRCQETGLPGVFLFFFFFFFFSYLVNVPGTPVIFLIEKVFSGVSAVVWRHDLNLPPSPPNSFIFSPTCDTKCGLFFSVGHPPFSTVK